MRAETAGLSDRLGLFPKVDVRVTGYVVVPPSVHESGHVYSWVRPIDDAVVPPAPPALLALLSRPRYHEVTGERAPWLVDALAGAGEGDRHGTCGRLAGYFLSKGIPEDVVRSLLLSWGARCSPPFDADEIEKYVADIAAKEPRTEPPSSIAESVDAVLARVLAPPASRKVAATGLASFDDLLGGGFETGTIFLGARPGVGKTALAMQIARRLALSGTGVFISTLEMSKEQLIRRMLVQESCVRATAVKTGQLVDIERAMLTKAAAKLRPLPIWFGEDLYTVAQLDAALSVYEPGAVGFAVVDYLQLMSAENDRLDNRQRVEAVGRGLKKLTRKYDLPLLVLSSLVRPTNDHNWRPSLKSLRESGELEHLGDVVFFLHRAETEKVQTELIHAKAREGEIGDLRLRFSGELQTFTEVV
jgi:replicative DNA helicase